MAGEECARQILERSLSKTVVLNDDGSAPGMYDLRVGPPNAPEIAIECIGAVDPIFTETWNLGPGRGSLHCSIRGDWIVTIKVGARVNVLRRGIESLLQELEARGFDNVHVDYKLQRVDALLFDRLCSLGIADALCYQAQGTGTVHLGMPGIGGAVDDQGTALPEWFGTFLRDPARQDVPAKLSRSGALHRHVFVIASFDGVPWSVASYLAGSLQHLPRQAPDLPMPVTGVWIVFEGSLKGVHWDGATWQRFQS
jgi:hypothetical protein